MAASVFLSPYLRPVLEDGGLVYDNGITEAMEPLTPLQHDVVRVLWNSMSAPIELRELQVIHGRQAVERAIAELRRRSMIFSERRECEAVFNNALAMSTPDVPFIDQIELTNVCPMRCGFCPRGVPGRMSRPTGLMDRSHFLRLLDQVNPVQARYRMIELHHLGESLVHPEVDSFVAAATERGIPTELAVNPSLLVPELARRLLDAGIRRLVISLDGMDDETLVALRGPKALYSKAEENLDALLVEAEKRSEPPEIVIQMLDLHRNRHQHEAFRRRWGELNLDHVEAYIKKLDGPDPDTGETTGNPANYLCTYPWRSVVVLWDGRVVPCCRDHDAAYVLGDLHEQSLRDIWRSPRARELRRAHQTNVLETGHLCETCDWRRDRFAEKMAERHPSTAVRNPLQW